MKATKKPPVPPPCPKCGRADRVKTFIRYRTDAPVNLAKNAPSGRQVAGYRCEACSHEWDA
jgi:hypothetical protein